MRDLEIRKLLFCSIVSSPEVVDFVEITEPNRDESSTGSSRSVLGSWVANWVADNEETKVSGDALRDRPFLGLVKNRDLN